MNNTYILHQGIKYKAYRIDFACNSQFAPLIRRYANSIEIEAKTSSEAKRFAVNILTDIDEILGDWLIENNGTMWVNITSTKRNIHASYIVLYVEPKCIGCSSACIWEAGIIIKDYNGNPLNSQFSYGERIKGEMVNRYVDIEKGIPINLPDDLSILGNQTENGFIMSGLKFK